jgi:hypothetical protein
MKHAIYKVMPGEYRMLVNVDIYFIKRQKIDYKTSWIADNIITSKPAFKEKTKKSLITKILQHHETKS